MDQLIRELESERSNEGSTYFSDAQYIVAFSFGILSCTLSLFGSTSIIYLVLKSKKLSSLYHRLMFGLSSMDLVVTTGIFLQPFFVPQYTGLLFAKGNEATCNAASFLMQYFLASYVYNAELSIYFLMTVRYGKSEGELTGKLEPYVHIVPVLTATLFSVLGLSLDLFGPDPVLGTCQYETTSLYCEKDGAGHCGRQHVARGVLWAHALITTAAILIGIACTWLIYRTVRQQEKKSRRWSYSNTEDWRWKKAVGTQAIWYTTAVLVGFVALVVATITSEFYSNRLEDGSTISYSAGLYAVYFLVWLLFPLQGFFNWVIYTRPRLLRWKDANPEQSWLWAYRQVMSGQPAPFPNRTAHLSINRHLSRIKTNSAPDKMTDAERMETASNSFCSEEFATRAM